MTDLVRIELVGGGRRPAQRIEAGARKLPRLILDEFRELTTKLRPIYVSHAPSDRGFAGGIRGRLNVKLAFNVPSAPRITVRATARDPETGFSYLRVSRYGHRKLLIFPKRAKALAVHYAGHRNPHIIAWRPYVEGYHPDSDWVEDATREAEVEFDRVATRLGREIDAQVIR